MKAKMYTAWKCRKCQATDVPLNGKESPEPYQKCIFGAAVGQYHEWERVGVKATTGGTTNDE